MNRPNSYENPAALAPAFVILLGGCAAIYAGSRGIPPFISIAAAILLSAAWMLLGTGRVAANWASLFTLILASVLAFASISLYRMNREADFPPAVEGEAKVLLNREWGRKRALLLSTRHGRFAACVPSLDAPPAGSLVRVRGAVFDLARASENSGFDEFLFWNAKGARKKLILLECAALEQPGAMYKLRHLLRKRIKETLPERTAGYLMALALGERTADLTDLHKNAGTLHILAVSGFHVAILAGMIGLLFRKGWVKVLIVSLIVWLYIWLAGAPPGGTRAALMLQFWLLSLPLGRPSSAFNNVSFAGIVMLLYEPWYFFDAGWRLSMLAALFLSAAGRLLGKGGAAAVASPLVWLVTAPQSAILFGWIPLAGLFINSVAVPLFSVIFPLVFILSLPSLAGVVCGRPAVLAAEYALVVWERFSTAVTGLVPLRVGYTVQLLALSAFIFCVAAMGVSGFSKNKITIASLILPIYLLLSA